MNKSKALDVLLGMKFMQRKEEAKRRALYESEQHNEIEHRLQELSAVEEGDFPSSSVPSKTLQGPIILYNSSFPRSGYQFARRTFTINTEKNSRPLDEETQNIVKDSVERSTSRTETESRDVVDNIWEEEENENENDPSAPLMTSKGTNKDAIDDDNVIPDKAREKGTKRGKKRAEIVGQKRFHPPNAISAPKLPKRLAEEIERQERNKRRRKDNYDE